MYALIPRRNINALYAWSTFLGGEKGRERLRRIDCEAQADPDRWASTRDETDTAVAAAAIEYVIVAAVQSTGNLLITKYYVIIRPPF